MPGLTVFRHPSNFLVSTPVFLLRIGDQMYDENSQYVGRVKWLITGQAGNIKIMMDTGSMLDLPARYEVAIVETT